jgi:hypothetical protein
MTLVPGGVPELARVAEHHEAGVDPYDSHTTVEHRRPDRRAMHPQTHLPSSHFRSSRADHVHA